MTTRRNYRIYIAGSVIAVVPVLFECYRTLCEICGNRNFNFVYFHFFLFPFPFSFTLIFFSANLRKCIRPWRQIFSGNKKLHDFQANAFTAKGQFFPAGKRRWWLRSHELNRKYRYIKRLAKWRSCS